MNGGRGISYEIALRWMPLDLTDDKSTLVQVPHGTKPLPEPMLTQVYVATASSVYMYKQQLINNTCMYQKQYISRIMHMVCTKLHVLFWFGTSWSYSCPGLFFDAQGYFDGSRSIACKHALVPVMPRMRRWCQWCVTALGDRHGNDHAGYTCPCAPQEWFQLPAMISSV